MALLFNFECFFFPLGIYIPLMFSSFKGFVPGSRKGVTGQPPELEGKGCSLLGS